MKLNGDICYIEFSPLKANHAGNKAREDINYICKKNNIKCIMSIFEKTSPSLFSKIHNNLSIDTVRVINQLRKIKNQQIILQYPFYINKLIKYSLINLIKKNCSILLIHDIDSFRNKDESELREECRLLNLAKILIVHNESMKKKLIEIGISTNMISLNAFDYILSSVPENKAASDRIAFAGNLGKSLFLTKMNLVDVKMNLYGPGYSHKISNPNIEYIGSFDPDEIPFKLEGRYGLIWDGNAIENCSGPVGEYLQYNNPHKMSLYIAAGLPIIVWDKAAIAKFVIDNGIGIVVNELTGLDKKINSVTNIEYEEMLKNVKKLQKRVISGYYTEKAFEKITMYC